MKKVIKAILIPLLGTFGSWIIWNLLDKLFPNIANILYNFITICIPKVIKNIISNVCSFFCFRVPIHLWVFILFILLSLAELIYICYLLLQNLSLNPKLKDKSSVNSVLILFKNYKNSNFNHDEYLIKLKLLNQKEKNLLFKMIFDLPIFDYSHIFTLTDLINYSNFFASYILTNLLIDKLVKQYSYKELIYYFERIDCSKYKCLKNRLKILMWDKFIIELEGSTFDAQNDILGTLDLKDSLSVPKKYQKRFYIAVLKVSASSAYTKDIAKKFFLAGKPSILLSALNGNSIIKSYLYYYKNYIKELPLNNYSRKYQQRFNKLISDLDKQRFPE